MSKSVVIPASEKPMWECEINGKKFSFEAGATVTVPDEVAALIAANAEMLPKEADVVESSTADVYTQASASTGSYVIPSKELTGTHLFILLYNTNNGVSQNAQIGYADESSCKFIGAPQNNFLANNINKFFTGNAATDIHLIRIKM